MPWPSGLWASLSPQAAARGRKSRLARAVVREGFNISELLESKLNVVVGEEATAHLQVMGVIVGGAKAQRALGGQLDEVDAVRKVALDEDLVEHEAKAQKGAVAGGLGEGVFKADAGDLTSGRRGDLEAEVGA